MSKQDELNKFTNSMQATVERADISSDLTAEMNEKLDVMGMRIGEEQAKHYRYAGSCAVHIYVNETLGHVAYVSQTRGLIVNECPEMVAEQGINDLYRRTQEQYGHTAPKKRNGF